MFVAAIDLQVFSLAAVLFDGAGFCFRDEVHARVALEHHGPIGVVGTQRGRDLEAAGQLEEEAHALVVAAVLGKFAFHGAVGQHA